MTSKRQFRSTLVGEHQFVSRFLSNDWELVPIGSSAGRDTCRIDELTPRAIEANRLSTFIRREEIVTDQVQIPAGDGTDVAVPVHALILSWHDIARPWEPAARVLRPKPQPKVP